jgi:hypothetical protein
LKIVASRNFVCQVNFCHTLTRWLHKPLVCFGL